MRWADQCIDLAPGAAFCLYPDMPYEATHEAQKRLGVCYARFDFLDRRGRITYPQDLPIHHCMFPTPRFYEALFRRAVDVLHEGPAKPARVLAERLLQSILLEMRLRGGKEARESSSMEALRIIMRQIRENPGEPVSVDELARRSGFGVERFSRTFLKLAGVTPKEYCIRARIARAEHLLRETDLSVEQISQALGYADVYFFSRQFKQRHGQPPTQWRKR
jgi:AraC-like DNA-binding protein